MDMAGRPGGVVVPLGHETHTAPVLPGDFLDGIFHQNVSVGHGERVGVVNVELGLTSVGLTLAALDRDPRLVEPIADGPHHIFLTGGLEDVVVLVIGADGRHMVILTLLHLLKGLPENEKLQFGGRGHLQPHG